MRKLKYHEQKLLKKVDFFNYKSDSGHREVKIARRYHLQDREDYTRYNKICGLITSLVSKLKLIKSDDSFRMQITEQLLDKLYGLGLINSKENLEKCEKISVSSFCRRRLPIILQQLKFVETNKEAVTFVEQGRNKKINKLLKFNYRYKSWNRSSERPLFISSKKYGRSYWLG